MSDYERNKYFRRTKFFSTSRDQPHFGSRPYNKSTGFTKHERDYRDDRFSSSESKEKTIQQPTILLKARDPQTERSVSPKRSSKENESAQNTPSTPTTETAPATIPTMSTSMKLIDDGSINFESIQEYLQDSPDFLVIGVLGSQGSGKSTILNLIAQNSLTEASQAHIFSPDRDSLHSNQESIKILTDSINSVKLEQDKKDNLIFHIQGLDEIEVGNYGTSGIDLYITSNRVFLLDCQPIMSPAALDEIVQNDYKRTVAGEFLPIENCAEIQSLQLATFILSVCHVVLIVEDWFLDSNVIRFLQTAEMLKPSIPMGEEDFMEYFPHAMIIHNKASLQDFTPAQFGIMQQVYREVFSKSKLRFDSGMGLGSGNSIIHGLSKIGEPINLFLLPEQEECEAEGLYQGHPGLSALLTELRNQLHSVTRIPLLSVQLTEKNWLQFSSKVWDTIKKSSFFLEYSKLMP